jgi:rubrerythrin
MSDSNLPYRTLGAALGFAIAGVANANARASMQREEKYKRVILEELRSNPPRPLFDQTERFHRCKSCGADNDETQWTCWMCGVTLW